MNYLEIIKVQQKKKYSNYINLKKDFLKSYLLSRYNLIKKCNVGKLIESNNQFNEKRIKLKKKINTEDYLRKIFFENERNKKISKKDKRILYKLYKKFEINLVLKKNYNLNLKKIGDKKTGINSYIYLGRLIFCLKEINIIQKINCLIKLNDFLQLNFSKIPLKNKKYFLKNIYKEIQEIKKF